MSQNFGIIIGKVVFENDVIAKKFLSFLPFWFSESSFFKLMFHTHVGTDIVYPHLIQNRAQNQRNSQGCM